MRNALLNLGAIEILPFDQTDWIFKLVSSVLFREPWCIGSIWAVSRWVKMRRTLVVLRVFFLGAIELGKIP